MIPWCSPGVWLRKLHTSGWSTTASSVWTLRMPLRLGAWRAGGEASTHGVLPVRSLSEEKMLARRNMFLDRLEDSKKENKDCFLMQPVHSKTTALHSAGPLKFQVYNPCFGGWSPVVTSFAFFFAWSVGIWPSQAWQVQGSKHLNAGVSGQEHALQMAVLMQTTTNSREVLDEQPVYESKQTTFLNRQCEVCPSYRLRYKRRYFWDSITHSFKPPSRRIGETGEASSSKPQPAAHSPPLPSPPPQPGLALPLRSGEPMPEVQDWGTMLASPKSGWCLAGRFIAWQVVIVHFTLYYMSTRHASVWGCANILQEPMPSPRTPSEASPSPRPQQERGDTLSILNADRDLHAWY